MTMEKYLWVIGALILTTLGFIHLILTFFTNKFSPRDFTVEKAMKLTSPMLTDKLSMWSGWQGFNASHSAGLIFMGLVNIYLAQRYFSVLKSDGTILLLNIFTIAFYIFLAAKYWFNIPLIGLSLALICFMISYLLLMLNR
jgi:hypothetical protein